MLVCLGACLIMIVSAYGFQNAMQVEHVTLDPRVSPPKSYRAPGSSWPVRSF